MLLSTRLDVYSSYSGTFTCHYRTICSFNVVQYDGCCIGLWVYLKVTVYWFYLPDWTGVWEGPNWTEFNWSFGSRCPSRLWPHQGIWCGVLCKSMWQYNWMGRVEAYLRDFIGINRIPYTHREMWATSRGIWKVATSWIFLSDIVMPFHNCSLPS